MKPMTANLPRSTSFGRLPTEMHRRSADTLFLLLYIVIKLVPLYLGTMIITYNTCIENSMMYGDIYSCI